MINPNNIIKKLINMRKYFLISFLLLMMLGLYVIYFVAPLDYQQYDAVRIMYIHVPSAWMALMVYGFATSCSIAYLIWKNPASSLLAYCALPIGICFTVICMVTGSIWGKPMWGTWWVWDSRLTSVTVLLFIYIGCFGLYHLSNDFEKSSKIAALFTIMGSINLPIVKFSVNFWNSLHQSSSISFYKIEIDKMMLIPLIIMFLSFILYFCTTLSYLLEGNINNRKITNLVK